MTQVEKHAEDGNRWRNARKRGAVDRIVDPSKSNPETEILAAAAERFVAEYLGLVVEKDIYQGADIQDLPVHGMKVDVKWTPLPYGNLLCKIDQYQQKPMCAYVLVAGPDVPEFQIIGWANREEMGLEQKDLGRGPGYFRARGLLRHIDLLKEYCLMEPEGAPGDTGKGINHQFEKSS